MTVDWIGISSGWSMTCPLCAWSLACSSSASSILDNSAPWVSGSFLKFPAVRDLLLAECDGGVGRPDRRPLFC